VRRAHPGTPPKAPDGATKDPLKSGEGRPHSFHTARGARLEERPGRLGRAVPGLLFTGTKGERKRDRQRRPEDEKPKARKMKTGRKTFSSTMRQGKKRLAVDKRSLIRGERGFPSHPEGRGRGVRVVRYSYGQEKQGLSTAWKSQIRWCCRGPLAHRTAQKGSLNGKRPASWRRTPLTLF